MRSVLAPVFLATAIAAAAVAETANPFPQKLSQAPAAAPSLGASVGRVDPSPRLRVGASSGPDRAGAFRSPDGVADYGFAPRMRKAGTRDAPALGENPLNK